MFILKLVLILKVDFINIFTTSKAACISHTHIYNLGIILYLYIIIEVETEQWKWHLLSYYRLWLSASEHNGSNAT